MQVTHKKQEQTDLLRKLEQLGFLKLSDFPREDFCDYQKYIKHPDLTYSLLYAWEPEYSYRIKILCGNPVIVGFEIPGQLFFSVIPVHAETLLESVQTAAELFRQFQVDVTLKYISSEYVNLFERKGFELTFHPDFSDYIYVVHDFIDTVGNQNKGKRHEYQNITKRYAIRRYEDMSESNYEDMLTIFDQWCQSRSCALCVWGCEKKAFLRLMELVHQYPEDYCCGIVYLDHVPMSFGIAEKINQEWVAYHVQKNAMSVNGLTYYLHHCMALKHMEIPYINWGEDMGIEGLRVNKQKYHPYRMEHKYQICFRYVKTSQDMLGQEGEEPF